VPRIKEIFLKRYDLLLTLFLFLSTPAWIYADTPKSRPDSHAPISVMGDHGHKTGETLVALLCRVWMLSAEMLLAGTAFFIHKRCSDKQNDTYNL